MNETTPLRGRIVIAKHDLRKTKTIRPLDEQQQHELNLVASMRVNERDKMQLNVLLQDALTQQTLLPTLFAFILVNGECQIIESAEQFEKTLVARSRVTELSRNQLSLDLQPFRAIHLRVSSLLIYLSRDLVSPMHVILTREIVCQAQKTSFWQRLFMPETDITYYKIIVDFGQTVPRNKLKNSK